MNPTPALRAFAQYDVGVHRIADSPPVFLCLALFP